MSVTQETLPLLKWADKKRTPRDVLCLAVVQNQWSAEQTDGEETHLTEADYDMHVKNAEELKAATLAAAGGFRAAKVVVHPGHLIAVVARRLRKAESDAVLLVATDDEKSSRFKEDCIVASLTDRLLWPSAGSAEWGFVAETYPIAVTVMAQSYIASHGAPGSGDRRRG